MHIDDKHLPATQSSKLVVALSNWLLFQGACQHVLTLLTLAFLQGSTDAELARARRDLAVEANMAAVIPEHPNLLRLEGILYDDLTRQHVGGVVYPLMRGGDLFSMLM